MATESVESDMGIGLGVLFSLLAAVGAVAMYVGGLGTQGAVDVDDAVAAWGFALAVTVGCLAVVAIHVYWE